MNRSFSRRSMLQAREESIALGHSMKFKDVVKDGQAAGGSGNGNNNNSSSSINNSSLSGAGASRRPSGISETQEIDDGAPDAHLFLSRHSWGSASSARRRHHAAVRAMNMFTSGVAAGGSAFCRPESTFLEKCSCPSRCLPPFVTIR